MKPATQEDATPRKSRCLHCNGRGIIGRKVGRVYSEIKCKECGGTGSVRKRSEPRLSVLPKPVSLSKEEKECRSAEDERRASSWEQVKGITVFQRGYGYEPAEVIQWNWRPEYQRWGALVRFADGQESQTYPKP